MKTLFEKKTETLILTGKVSEGNIKLFLSAQPLLVEGEKSEYNRQDILDMISEHVPLDLVNTGVVDDIVLFLNKGEKVEDRRIVKGKEAEKGRDGKILFLVKKFGGQGGVAIDARGYAEYSKLHLFDNIQIGQKVARIYEPKEGVDGQDIFGEPIKAEPGEVFKIVLDKSVSLQQAEESDSPYQVVVANQEGYLLESDGQLKISDELIVQGDLDFKHGSLEFVGKVIVKGDVLQGFNINAKSGIEITGSVRGGSLISVEGDIVVNGHIYGGPGSQVISGKSFTASVAQEINAEILGDINIKKEAIDCTLRTQTSIFMPTGRLIGGEALVVCGIEARFIGSEAGRETVIRLCSDVETTLEYGQLAVSIESHKKALSLIKMHLGPLIQNPSRIQLLIQPQRGRMEKLYAKMESVEKSLMKLKVRKKEMLDNAAYNKELRCNYLEKIYQGVNVFVGKEHYRPEEDLIGPGTLEFDSENSRFELTELKPLECSIDSQ